MVSAADLLTKAERVAAESATWADLHNALFDPVDGLLARAYPTPEARAEFIRTPQYKAIQKLLGDAIDRSGLVNGGTPQKSGRFVLRLPKSLHAALDHEAKVEGVSLNQLAVTKLAAQLSRISSDPMGGIIRAFAEIRSGYSADRVVADPAFDQRFLDRCRELGVPGSDFDLNWALFNARKNGHLSYLPKTKRYTAVNPDAYEHASEIAVRHVQRTQAAVEGTEPSLDRIICDPVLATLFDKAAARLAPGFDSLDYRWVALGLRKARRLKGKSMDLEVPSFEEIGRLTKSTIGSLPKEEGLYLIRGKKTSLFVGETASLRDRLHSHFKVAGPALLPTWLVDEDLESIRVSVAITPGSGNTTRKALEFSCIRKFNPTFNYLDSAAEAA